MARGYLYVVNTDENASMDVSEEELYNLTGHQFDYVENMPEKESKELVEDLMKKFAAYGAETGTEELNEGEFPICGSYAGYCKKVFCTKTADTQRHDAGYDH